MFGKINEAQSQKWAGVLNESHSGLSESKRNWMSQLLAVHEIKEAVQSGSVDGGIYSTPLNTMGMGNVAAPADYTNNVDFHKGTGLGSGDQFPTTLPMALNIASITIGLDLVPVVVAPGPTALLTYMDFPYGGGKLGGANLTSLDGKGEGTENKPIYIKVVPTNRRAVNISIKEALTVGTEYTIEGSTGVFTGSYVGVSRIDNGSIFQVVSAVSGDDNVSIADVFDADALTIKLGDTELVEVGKAHPELVATMADHIPGFSNFATGADELMTRAQNETGVGNTIGAKVFSKFITMGSHEVTGSVTRQQLQDLPLHGVDVVSKVLEAMQNEISQNISKQILKRVFALGVTNAMNQKDYQGVDLNLLISNDPSAAGKTIDSIVGKGKFTGVDGVDYGTEVVKSSSFVTSAENFMTNQRRIMSKLLVATNLIASVGRRGKATWAVSNMQVITALQDISGFTPAPMVNNLSQDGESLFFAGRVAGLDLYIDPNMPWNDTRICVGRKGNGDTPGVVFMPYILADTVQTLVEGTMAPKLLINSRYQIVDAGFNPEQHYLTFVVSGDTMDLV